MNKNNWEEDKTKNFSIDLDNDYNGLYTLREQLLHLRKQTHGIVMHNMVQPGN
jgi:hypothetical protein